MTTHLQVIISPDSQASLEELKKISDASNIQTQRNITGDVLVMITAPLAAAASVMKSIEMIVNGSKSVLKSRKVHAGKGSILIEGFDTEETIQIIEAIKAMKLHKNI